MRKLGVVETLLTLAFAAGCGSRQEQTGPPPVETSAPDTLEYVARGNEPFWSVSVTSREVVFRTPEHIDGIRGPYRPADPQGAGLAFHTTLGDSTPLLLTLEARPCEDSMSGIGFAYTAVARIGDQVLHGCGETRPAAPLGDWQVIAHRIPGTSAMSDAEAAAWHGRSAHYTSAGASFGTESCSQPSYRFREVRGDSLLAVDYRASPALFELKPGASITVIEVACGDSPWAAPGGTLFQMPNGTLHAVWDGVFFELRRDAPDARP